MSPAVRIVLFALVPVLPNALRQTKEGEHASKVFQAQAAGEESGWTQCCVSEHSKNYC